MYMQPDEISSTTHVAGVEPIPVLPQDKQQKNNFKVSNKFKSFIFVLIFAVVGTIYLAFSSASPPPEKVSFKGVRGEVAIEVLGDRINAVAVKNNLAADQLKKLFLEDSTLEVDDGDNLLYVEPGASETELKLDKKNTAAEALVDNVILSEGIVAAADPTVDDAFNLSSNPTSTRTIYLDFDGHTTTGTSWNSSYNIQEIVSVAVDTDGDRTTFSAAERQIIIDVWTAVAEDYSPYFINVTTKDPGVEALKKSSTSDTAYGIRVVISPTNWYGSAGGIAYVNSFSLSSDTPAFVFLCCSVPKKTAEASSHEVGHSLNLRHDGTSTATYYTGQGDWAPIMGNSYYKNFTQFSKGEYSGANNTQDDLSLILGNGVQLTQDEAGSTSSASAPLKLVGTTYNQNGIIGSTTDVDVYSFTWAGGPASFDVRSSANVTTFNASLLSVGNLDPTVRILNSTGQQVVFSDPIGNVPAVINTDLAAGTYYIEIKGVGYLDPVTTGYSNYASLGSYIITSNSGGVAPVAANQPPSAKISANPTSGVAPVSVNLSSAGSTDPEGKALTYFWNFGNGTTSALANPAVTYASAGSYTVTLSVTDSAGLTTFASTSINVSTTSQKMTVSAVTINKTVTRKQSYATVGVIINSDTGQPVSGATVTGTWTGGISGIGTAITGSDGMVLIRSKNVRKGATITFTVTSVTHSSSILSYIWDNVQKSVSTTF